MSTNPNAKITQYSIKDSAVGTAELINAAVTNIKLAPLAVTGDKIAAATITDDNIASVGGSKIANASITFNKFDSSVSANQSEAEAGVIDDKFMTPLKTKQSIDFNRNPQLIAGETISGATTPQAVCIPSLGTQQPNEENLTYDTGVATNYVSQTFLTSADAGRITSISVRFHTVSGAANQNVTLQLRTTSGGVPTNTSIASKVQNVNIPVGGIGNGVVVEFAFDAPVTVSSSTTYAIVVDTPGNLAVSVISTSAYADGDAYISTTGTGGWSIFGSNGDLYFSVISFEAPDGKVYKADSNEDRLTEFIGFIKENVVADDLVRIRQNGLAGFVGRSLGTKYYVSTTAGAITTSGTIEVGIGVSGGDLLIKGAL